MVINCIVLQGDLNAYVHKKDAFVERPFPWSPLVALDVAHQIADAIEGTEMHCCITHRKI